MSMTVATKGRRGSTYTLFNTDLRISMHTLLVVLCTDVEELSRFFRVESNMLEMYYGKCPFNLV